MSGIGPIAESKSQHLPAEQSPRNTDPAAEAERILDVGSRPIIADNYEARLEAFADSMEGGDAVFRQQLMKEILDRDPNALNSWLDVDIIDNETDGGRISSVQRSIIGEALAGAYNAGHPALATFEIPANANGDPDQTIQVGALDGIVTQYSDTGGEDRLENADRVRAFIDLMKSSQGPEAREFRETYARHLIDQFVLQDNVDSSRRGAAAAIAAELLTGETAHPLLGTQQNATAINVLDNLREKGQLNTFFEQLDRGSNMLSRDVNEGIAEADGRYDSRDIFINRDGVSSLIRTVANNSSPKADQIAVELAKLPSEHGDWFEGDSALAQDRTSALSSAFYTHSEAILDDLTVYNRSGAGTPDNPNQQQYNVNVDVLGSLFGAILYNPDAPLPGVVQSKVEEYAAGLTEGLNSVGNNRGDVLPQSSPFAGEDSEDLIGRLAVLSAGTSDAITNQWEAIKADQESRAEAIGFVVDLVLAVIPPGRLVNGQVKDALAEVLPEGALRTAIEDFTGQLVDNATGRLTTEAKQQLAESLGPDTANALEQSSLQDALEEGLVAGIENNDRRTDVIERADRLTGDS